MAIRLGVTGRTYRKLAATDSVINPVVDCDPQHLHGTSQLCKSCSDFGDAYLLRIGAAARTFVSLHTKLGSHSGMLISCQASFMNKACLAYPDFMDCSLSQDVIKASPGSFIVLACSPPQHGLDLAC